MASNYSPPGVLQFPPTSLEEWLSDVAATRAPRNRRQVAVPKRRHRDLPAQSYDDTASRRATRESPRWNDGGYEIMPSQATALQNVAKPTYENISAPATSKSRGGLSEPLEARWPGLILQPDSSPISEKQLTAEIKGIYAGLVMVEAKCINIDTAQADPSAPLDHEQWQALIALHRTLLYEHHDFLMATQHPSATPTLRSLATKYSMPARMWKHGIHAFLEVLRRRRPDSQDHMLSFIYLAYQMMALLYENVPVFLDTWTECLGDLARYRMAIEEEDIAHAQWGSVATAWYAKSPHQSQVGRLYHHLAILERPSLRRIAFHARNAQQDRARWDQDARRSYPEHHLGNSDQPSGRDSGCHGECTETICARSEAKGHDFEQGDSRSSTHAISVLDTTRTRLQRTGILHGESLAGAAVSGNDVQIRSLVGLEHYTAHYESYFLSLCSRARGVRQQKLPCQNGRLVAALRSEHDPPNNEASADDRPGGYQAKAKTANLPSGAESVDLPPLHGIPRIKPSESKLLSTGRLAGPCEIGSGAGIYPQYRSTFGKPLKRGPDVLRPAKEVCKILMRLVVCHPLLALIFATTLPGATALHTDHHTAGGRGREPDVSVDIGPQSIPYGVILIIGLYPLYVAATGSGNHPEWRMIALILAGVFSVLLCALSPQVDQLYDILSYLECAWFLAMINLLVLCAKSLQHRTVFILLTVFVGGGPPAVLLVLLANDGIAVDVARRTQLTQSVFFIGPSLETLWVAAVFGTLRAAENWFAGDGRGSGRGSGRDSGGLNVHTLESQEAQTQDYELSELGSAILESE